MPLTHLKPEERNTGEPIKSPLENIVIDDFAKDTQETKPVVKSQTTPWSPAKLLQVAKIPGFRLHWVTKERLAQARFEGWEPVKGTELKGTNSTLIDGSQLDSLVTKRNLVLCKMPEEKARQMDAYFAGKSKEAMNDSIEAYQQSVDKDKSYGNITVTHE